jgi:hypothetical protein
MLKFNYVVWYWALGEAKKEAQARTCAEKLRLKKMGFSRNVRDKLHITVRYVGQ